MRTEDKGQYNSRYTKTGGAGDTTVNNVSSIQINDPDSNPEFEEMRPESLKIFMALKDADCNFETNEKKIHS